MNRASVSLPRMRLPGPPAEPLLVLVDTREQAPLTSCFPPVIGRERRRVVFKIDTLPTGDYSTVPLRGRAVVERKSPGDFVSTVTHDRDRWDREVERLAELELAAVIVEGGFDEACSATAADWRSLVGTLMHLDVRRRIPVHFVGSRLAAGWAVCSWLRRAEKELLPAMTATERLRDAAERFGLYDRPKGSGHIDRGMRELVERETRREEWNLRAEGRSA